MKTNVYLRNGAFFFVLLSLFVISFSIRLSASIESYGVQENEIGLTDEIDTIYEDSENISTILEELRVKGDELKSREKVIEDREEYLRELSRNLNAKIESLEAAEERLRTQIKMARKSAENDVETVINIYEEMKPKDAAAIFELMAPSLAAGLIVAMDTKLSSEILSKMSPEKSYAISVFVAGRNAQSVEKDSIR